AVVVVGVVLLVRPLFGERKARDEHQTASAKDDSGEDGSEGDTDPGLNVKTVYPHNDPTFVREVASPAYVEAYYKVDIFAQVAGKVTYIEKNIGDRVSAGEVLVEVDDPELTQDVVQKEVLVLQASKEADAAKSREKTMEEAVVAAQH